MHASRHLVRRAKQPRCLIARKQVLYLLRQLPGGPDESGELAALAAQRTAALAAIEAVESKCVCERPQPPQYGALQQDVAAFTANLGAHCYYVLFRLCCFVL